MRTLIFIQSKHCRFFRRLLQSMLPEYLQFTTLVSGMRHLGTLLPTLETLLTMTHLRLSIHQTDWADPRICLQRVTNNLFAFNQKNTLF